MVRTYGTTAVSTVKNTAPATSVKPGGMVAIPNPMGGRGSGEVKPFPGGMPGGVKTPGKQTSGYPDIDAMGITMPSYINNQQVASNLQQGKTWNGQFLPNTTPGADYQFKAIPTYSAYQYQPIQSYKPFQFNTPNISNMPANVFKQMKTQNVENAQMGLKAGLAELSKNNAARGLGGKSGVLSGQQYSLADDMQDQLASANRELDMQQAQSQLDVGKLMAQMQMDTQSQQAAQNMGASQFNAQLSQWLQGSQAAEKANAAQFNAQNQQWLQGAQADNILQMNAQRLQNRQMLGNESLQNLQLLQGLQQQASSEAMMPFNMLLDLYKADTGIPFTMGGGSSGIFGGLMGLGGTLGAAALCLPLGTQVELEDGGTQAVEEIRVGDRVKGGEVIKIYSRKRPENHWFTKHYFKNGAVITMTLGHPYHDELERASPDYDEKSPCTCDILTDSGVYYVNGVKLGSTLS